MASRDWNQRGSSQTCLPSSASLHFSRGKPNTKLFILDRTCLPASGCSFSVPDSVMSESAARFREPGPELKLSVHRARVSAALALAWSPRALRSQSGAGQRQESCRGVEVINLWPQTASLLHNAEEGLFSSG